MTRCRDRTSIRCQPCVELASKESMPTLKDSAGKPRSPVMKLKWKVENLDSDDTTYTIPLQATRVEVSLLHQTTTREYAEFLRDTAPAPAGQNAYDRWVARGRSAPIVMDRLELALHRRQVARGVSAREREARDEVVQHVLVQHDDAGASERFGIDATVKLVISRVVQANVRLRRVGLDRAEAGQLAQERGGVIGYAGRGRRQRRPESDCHGFFLGPNSAVPIKMSAMNPIPSATSMCSPTVAERMSSASPRNPRTPASRHPTFRLRIKMSPEKCLRAMCGAEPERRSNRQ